MEIRHPAVAIALLVTFGAPVPRKVDKIDDYITAQIKRLHVPGASLAVSLGGNSYWFLVNMTKDGKIAQIYWW
jgi:hypothetical protein